MWRSYDIERATQGKPAGRPFDASGVFIDSRKPIAGGLFVALKGERVDGHDYVADVLAAGATGALVQREIEGLDASAPLIHVTDTYKALEGLAQEARARTRARVIAVTGSVGKTGTKEALRTALASVGKIYATEGNLNNHIGLPLSLANLPEDVDFGVFELGMNHAGELSGLTRIARPDIAVITNVEAVHLEFFAHVEAIADAKAEIFEGMQPTGTAVLNLDNAYYTHLLAKAKAQGIASVVTFGADAQAQCRLTGYRLEETGSRVEAVIHGVPITYRLGTTGRHWALTSLAALAASVAAGADLADAAAALEHFHEPDGRGKLQRVAVEGGFATLIDDCYNASPSSVKAALAKLSELNKAAQKGGRSVAVLGDMLELGKGAAGLHRELAQDIAYHGIDKAYLAGPLMRHLYDDLAEHKQGAHTPDADSLAPLVLRDLRAGDIILIKGSRGSRMDIVRDRLLAAASPSEKASAHAL